MCVQGSRSQSEAIRAAFANFSLNSNLNFFHFSTKNNLQQTKEGKVAQLEFNFCWYKSEWFDGLQGQLSATLQYRCSLAVIASLVENVETRCKLKIIDSTKVFSALMCFETKTKFVTRLARYHSERYPAIANEIIAMNFSLISPALRAH